LYTDAACTAGKEYDKESCYGDNCNFEKTQTYKNVEAVISAVGGVMVFAAIGGCVCCLCCGLGIALLVYCCCCNKSRGGSRSSDDDRKITMKKDSS